MSKLRGVVCQHYTHEGGKCSKSNKECHFWKEMQKCQKYQSKPNGKNLAPDRRGKLKRDAERNDRRKERWE